jgi:hypothetical protein
MNDVVHNALPNRTVRVYSPTPKRGGAISGIVCAALFAIAFTAYLLPDLMRDTLAPNDLEPANITFIERECRSVLFALKWCSFSYQVPSESKKLTYIAFSFDRSFAVGALRSRSDPTFVTSIYGQQNIGSRWFFYLSFLGFLGWQAGLALLKIPIQRRREVAIAAISKSPVEAVVVEIVNSGRQTWRFKFTEWRPFPEGSITRDETVSLDAGRKPIAIAPNRSVAIRAVGGTEVVLLDDKLSQLDMTVDEKRVFFEAVSTRFARQQVSP